MDKRGDKKMIDIKEHGGVFGGGLPKITPYFKFKNGHPAKAWEYNYDFYEAMGNLAKKKSKYSDTYFIAYGAGSNLDTRLILHSSDGTILATFDTSGVSYGRPWDLYEFRVGNTNYLYVACENGALLLTYTSNKIDLVSKYGSNFGMHFNSNLVPAEIGGVQYVYYLDIQRNLIRVNCTTGAHLLVKNLNGVVGGISGMTPNGSLVGVSADERSVLILNRGGDIAQRSTLPTGSIIPTGVNQVHYDVRRNQIIVYSNRPVVVNNTNVTQSFISVHNAITLDVISTYNLTQATGIPHRTDTYQLGSNKFGNYFSIYGTLVAFDTTWTPVRITKSVTHLWENRVYLDDEVLISLTNYASDPTALFSIGFKM
jgi:hypothetical protein